MTQAEKIAALLAEKPHLGSAALARMTGVPAASMTRILRRLGVERADERCGRSVPLPDLSDG